MEKPPKKIYDSTLVRLPKNQTRVAGMKLKELWAAAYEAWMRVLGAFK